MRIHRLSKIVAGWVAIFILWLFLASNAPAVQPTDDFLQGYATAVVAINYPSAVQSIRVREGVVYLHGVTLSEEEKMALEKVLSDISGLHGVEFVEGGHDRRTPAGGGRLGNEEIRPQEHLPVFLPQNQIFQPLLADPRWPHFSVSAHRYRNDDRLRNAASANFGESFGIYRFRGPWKSTLELGIHAGVFSIFDLDAESFDLINADYLIGIPLTLKKGDLALQTRVFHQSSHLGDEFLLRGRTDERINLSYESVNSLISYHLPAGFRFYAGGEYILHKDPSDLDPWATQVGLEFRSPWFWFNGALRPVAAIDVQHRQESNWNTDLSVRAGVEFENPDFLSRKLQLLLEYYNGQSPNGQFYERNIEFFGLGLHFFLN